MGARISPLNPLAAGQTAELREGQGRRIGEPPSASADIAGPADARRANLSALTANTLRAANLARTADEALVEIDGILREIRDIEAEADSRIFPGEDDLDEFQGRINRNIIRLNVIVETTRFFGVTLFDGSLSDEPFEIGQGNVVVVTVPNLSRDRLGAGLANRSGFDNLSQVNLAFIPPGVRLPRALTDAFLVTDSAIADVGRAREQIEAFRGEVFASAFRALRAERAKIGLDETGVNELNLASAIPGAALSEILRQADLIAERIAPDRSGVLLDLVV